ncbi:hypothetical protein HY374_03770 [Candidatus Berkelbacteria bacterium]|nr:hypothetical protein [Candidatus Berkelbacteria bacterium]
MRTLSGEEALVAERHFAEAARVARQAKCLRAHGGSVIVSNGKIIGRGYNSPPGEKESNRTCRNTYAGTEKPRFDLTCCVHAEWRAILDAQKHHPEQLLGSRIYYIRINDDGSYRSAGKPYCTVCSRLALEVGIAEFALWHDDGSTVYDTTEYDQLSYQFFQPSKE